MNTCHRFTVGNFQCAIISDGEYTYSPPMFPPPANFLFLNALPDRLSYTLKKQGLDPENWSSWTSSYLGLLIDTGQEKILVDTGAGNLGENTGKLLVNLKQAGVSAGDIDLVILTHGHPDHLGGNIDSLGNIAFPRARWVMSGIEWQFWASQLSERQLAEREREILVGIARKNLLPLQSRLALIDGESDILPGIRAIPAPGHTPGQIAISVKSAGRSFLHISDVVLHSVHLEQPDWYAAVDMDPASLIATRQKILSLAVVEQSLVLASHFSFPGLGSLVSHGNSWLWKAVLV